MAKVIRGDDRDARPKFAIQDFASTNDIHYVTKGRMGYNPQAAQSASAIAEANAVVSMFMFGLGCGLPVKRDGHLYSLGRILALARIDMILGVGEDKSAAFRFDRRIKDLEDGIRRIVLSTPERIVISPPDEQQPADG